MQNMGLLQDTEHELPGPEFQDIEMHDNRGIEFNTLPVSSSEV